MEAEADRIQIRDYQIYSFATRHDGKQYLRVPHRSYLIQWKDDLVWISGDAVFKPEFAVKVKNFCVSRNIAAAFANLYQMESLEGLRFLEALSPGLLCLYHLPFPEDDACHYHRMAKTVLDRRKKAGYQILQIMPEQQLRVSHGCARISR